MNKITKEALSKMLDFSSYNHPSDDEKPRLDIYNNANLTLNEAAQFSKSLYFSSDYMIQVSIYDFLDVLGFKSFDNGYKFLHFIISFCVSNEIIPQKMRDFYEMCGKKYGVTANCVESSILKAISSATKSKLFSNYDKVFQLPLSDEPSRITNGYFINFVCQRFVMAKQHNKVIFFTL